MSSKNKSKKNSRDKAKVSKMFGVKMIETCIVPDEKREWMAREKKNLWAQIATHLYRAVCSCIVH